MSESSSLSLDWGLGFDVCSLVLGSQFWGPELFFRRSGFTGGLLQHVSAKGYGSARVFPIVDSPKLLRKYTKGEVTGIVASSYPQTLNAGGEAAT